MCDDAALVVAESDPLVASVGIWRSVVRECGAEKTASTVQGICLSTSNDRSTRARRALRIAEKSNTPSPASRVSVGYNGG